MIRTLLVPLDGSPFAEAALPQAKRVAQTVGGTVVLMQAVAGGVMAPSDQGDALAEAELYLQAVAGALASSGCPVRHERCVAAPAEGILHAARENRADMIVMSTHGLSGLRRALLGSVADEVLRRTDLPVLLVQPGHTAHRTPESTGPFRTILIPLDRTPGAEAALRLIAQEEFARAAEILVVHSEVPVAVPGTVGAYAYGLVPGMSIPQYAVDEAARETDVHCRDDQAYLERLAQTYLAGRAWHADVPRDDAGHAIVRVAVERHADLIAMTTHARTGLERLAEGSVAAHVLHHAGVPVLLLRQDTRGGVEPVLVGAGVTRTVS